MNSVPEEERFSKNASIMTQAIQESVSKLYKEGYKTVDPNMVALAAGFISAFDKNFLIQGFIQNSHNTCWDKIKERDEDFMINNSGDIFKYLPMDKVSLFRDLFLTKDDMGESVVPDSLKEQLWDILGAMVKISIKYIHKHRSPFSKIDSSGNEVRGYKNSFFDQVDVPYHTKVWGIAIEFPR